MNGSWLPQRKSSSGADGFFSNRFVLQAMETLGKALRTKTGYHVVAITGKAEGARPTLAVLERK